jgi:CheY-like chemotaxis protein
VTDRNESMHRLLVVDDDESVRRLLKERLADSYEILDTGNPTEALALALDLAPKCILLDLLMPRLTGFELCRTFSSLSLTRRIPILVLSGNPVGEYGEFCSHIGAQDYFQKPVDFVRLRDRIAQLLDDDVLQQPAELRLSMQVSIELRGLNRSGQAFHELTTTEDVSVSGFRCACAATLDTKAVVEVFLGSQDAKRRIGRAQVVHKLLHATELPRYGFQFTQRPSEWLL